MSEYNFNDVNRDPSNYRQMPEASNNFFPPKDADEFQLSKSNMNTIFQLNAINTNFTVQGLEKISTFNRKK